MQVSDAADEKEKEKVFLATTISVLAPVLAKHARCTQPDSYCSGMWRRQLAQRTWSWWWHRE
eukprot:m.373472 g.373472  ORF g.373472 m.373472 type:complete len:62 (-) comp28162_c0_seq10:3616-3801(-)